MRMLAHAVTTNQTRTCCQVSRSCLPKPTSLEASRYSFLPHSLARSKALKTAKASTDAQQQPMHTKSHPVLSHPTHQQQTQLKMPSAFFLFPGDSDPTPILNLCKHLSSTFETIHLAVPSNFTHCIPETPSLQTHALPFKTTDFHPYIFYHALGFKFLQLVTRKFDPIRMQTKLVADLIEDILVPSLGAIHDLATRLKPSLVIGTTLVGPIAEAISESLRVRLILLNVHPNTPTSAFPSYVAGRKNALLAAKEVALALQSGAKMKDSAAYMTTHMELSRLFKGAMEELNVGRLDIGLSQITVPHIDHLYRGRRPNVNLINAYPLVPRPQDWPKKVHLVGSLADEEVHEGWEAEKECPQLVEFLSHGDKPLCIFFGATVVGEDTAISLSKQLLKGAYVAGVERVIILESTANIHVRHVADDAQLKDWAEKHVMTTKERPPYSWLFERCSMLFCDGGPDVLVAGLKAGLPTVVAPVLSAHYFWGALISELGLGALVTSKLKKGDPKLIERAVQEATSEKVREKVREFREGGKGGECECGVQKAADIIAKVLVTPRV